MPGERLLRLTVALISGPWVACASIPVVPAGEGIVVYSGLDYRGPSMALNADVKNLERLDGPCEYSAGSPLEPGDLDTISSWGDCISSVRVQAGWTATLYQDDNFGGVSVTITGDTPDLARVPGPCRGSFAACVSSIRVSRTP